MGIAETVKAVGTAAMGIAWAIYATPSEPIAPAADRIIPNRKYGKRGCKSR